MCDIDSLTVREKPALQEKPGSELQEDIHASYMDDFLKMPVSGRNDFDRTSVPKYESKEALSDLLSEQGINPVADKNDIADTLAKAAVAFNNTDIGLPSDYNKSSGTAVSRLLEYVGAGVKQTGNIEILKQQLDKLGWESRTLGSADDLRPGDLLFTSMDPRGRNVGIVGSDNKIYSHSLPAHAFQGRSHWGSKFITVMRQKD